MRSRSGFLAALAALAACGDVGPMTAPAPRPAEPLTAVSFNVHGTAAIHDPVTGPTMAAQLADREPDFAALQECVDCADLLALLPGRFDLIDADGPNSILYDATRWAPVDDGAIVLGDDDDGWGRREARWARFEAPGGAALEVYSTHWCVTIRRPDDACDVDRHLAYAQRMLDAIGERGAPAVLVGGDLNVFDGFEDSAAVILLEESGLVDLFRAGSADDVITFPGNSWAPAGRIDYLFGDHPLAVQDAEVDDSVGPPAGSDHFPVVATFTFE